GSAAGTWGHTAAAASGAPREQAVDSRQEPHLDRRTQVSDDGRRWRARMAAKLTVYVVDDSRTQAEITGALLEKAGHDAIISTASQEALTRIPCVKPDCVVFDLMMPGLDGYELCRRLRQMPGLGGTRRIVVSSKASPSERRRRLEMGADASFVKPLAPATFAADVERLVAGTLTVRFWGVRGTLPVSRPDSRRYGGNTLC